MKVIALILLSFSLINTASADWFSKKLSVYQCNNQHQVTSCSAGCKKDAELKVEFLVDKKNSRVMTKFFSNREIVSSSVDEDCKIFDDTNWDCTSKFSFPKGDDTFFSKMSGGIYSYYYRQVTLTNNNKVKFEESRFICAK